MDACHKFSKKRFACKIPIVVVAAIMTRAIFSISRQKHKKYAVVFQSKWFETENEDTRKFR
jgi:hypothetical protein